MSTKVDIACKCCKTPGHNIFTCKKFKKINLVERKNFVQSERICFRCLNHKFSVYQPCQETREKFDENHHELLHFEDKTTTTMTVKSANTALLATAQIEVQSNTGKWIIFRHYWTKDRKSQLLPRMQRKNFS